MTQIDDAAQQHYEAALAGLTQIRQCLLKGTLPAHLALLENVRGHVEQAFWQARLRQQVTRASVAATPYCRTIPLASAQRKHVESLRQGMWAAERSFIRGGEVAPWNALLYGRYKLKTGRQRESFECGFVIRMFQLLQEAKAEPPARAPDG